MSAEDYGYESYDARVVSELAALRSRIAELEANIIECDAMTNTDRKPRKIEEAELSIVRMASEGRAAIDRLAELEAQVNSDATLTPRKCVTCDGVRMAEAMREACADAVRKLSRMNSAYEDVIRAIPLPVCNPLAPLVRSDSV